MSAYRSHTCGELTAANAGSEIRLSGWVHRVRDHGGVLFIDLRDHYGITQVIADSDSPAFAALEKLRAETVIRITDTQYSKDVLSVNNTGRVAEYRLNYRISFSATHQGEPVLENATLRLSRTLTWDENSLLSKESEEATLVRDMQNDVVPQVLRRVSALVKKAKLPAGYEIVSTSLEAYTESIKPLGKLAERLRIVRIVLLIVGGLLIMALFHLFKYAALRQPQLGYYCALVLCLALYQASIGGLMSHIERIAIRSFLSPATRNHSRIDSQSPNRSPSSSMAKFTSRLVSTASQRSLLNGIGPDGSVGPQLNMVIAVSFSARQPAEVRRGVTGQSSGYRWASSSCCFDSSRRARVDSRSPNTVPPR